MNHSPLFESYKLGSITLNNRIVMAPMTRNRAESGLLPSQFAAQYYSQRASAGLIITEATQISRSAQGYQNTPGIYTNEQIEAWKQVTQAVHAKGGKIFVQLWHVGRISHVDLQENGELPLAPSAIKANTKTFVNNGFHDVSEPRALALNEIPKLVEDFKQASINAIAAGFDGVEIHGANGYLLEQFLKDGTNHRTDLYGGSVENRARLILEVCSAVTQAIGADKVGVRISPVSPANDISCSDPQPQYNYLVDELNKLGIVYLHMIEGATGGPRDIAPFDYEAIRQRFSNTLLVNNQYNLDLAKQQIKEGANLVAFGRPYIANPDLVERFKKGVALADLDPTTLYGGSSKGYIDYPYSVNV